MFPDKYNQFIKDTMYCTIKERVDYIIIELKTDMCKAWEDQWYYGKVEGKAEGRAEGKAEATIELLEDIGEPSPSLRKLIMEQTDLEVLRRWHKLAARAGSIEEFERASGILEKV